MEINIVLLIFLFAAAVIIYEHLGSFLIFPQRNYRRRLTN